MNELREEILISKAVGGDATPQEWDELNELAQRTPELWQRLAGCLRDERALDRALGDAGEVAESVEIPALRLGPAAPRGPGFTTTRWLGWAVAAAIALSWTAGTLRLDRAGPMHDSTQNASLANASAADLLRAYLDKGRQEQRVIGELPDRVLVNTRPAPAGEGYELLYVRQIFEREVVPELYRPGAQDEQGRTATLIRYEAPQRPPM